MTLLFMTLLNKNARIRYIIIAFTGILSSNQAHSQVNAKYSCPEGQPTAVWATTDDACHPIE